MCIAEPYDCEADHGGGHRSSDREPHSHPRTTPNSRAGEPVADNSGRSELLDRLAGSLVAGDTVVLDPGCGLAQVILDLGQRTATMPSEAA
jgi:hypothetical protein